MVIPSDPAQPDAASGPIWLPKMAISGHSTHTIFLYFLRYFSRTPPDQFFPDSAEPRLDDDRDLIVVMVAEPEEGHPPTTHVAFLITSNRNNKNHYNNCSGNKQSKS
jgi:hypothetical protein